MITSLSVGGGGGGGSIEADLRDIGRRGRGMQRRRSERRREREKAGRELPVGLSRVWEWLCHNM